MDNLDCGISWWVVTGNALIISLRLHIPSRSLNYFTSYIRRNGN